MSEAKLNVFYNLTDFKLMLVLTQHKANKRIHEVEVAI